MPRLSRNEGFAMPGANGQMRSAARHQGQVREERARKRLCVECHKDITEIPHEKVGTRQGQCVQCHQELGRPRRRKTRRRRIARARRGVKQIDRYMKSIHARPNKEDQSRTNATCYNCHDAHYVYPQGSPVRAEWRLNIPNVCGKCHSQEREEYATSVHGKEVLQNAQSQAAVCSDCHTTHDIEDPSLDTTRLVITKNCGNCHAENLKSYTRDLSRPGQQAGLRPYRQVLRLPWQPRHPAGQRSEIDGASRQPPADLPEMP